MSYPRVFSSDFACDMWWLAQPASATTYHRRSAEGAELLSMDYGCNLSLFSSDGIPSLLLCSFQGIAWEPLFFIVEKMMFIAKYIDRYLM
jgi:hypothetical protein